MVSHIYHRFEECPISLSVDTEDKVDTNVLTSQKDVEEYARLICKTHNKCMICGQPKRYGQRLHFGEIDGHKQVVGSCCQSRLTTTSGSFKIKKPVYQEPDDSIVIWRYMNVTKLLSFIQTESLYFNRLDSFEDKSEGALGMQSDYSDFKKKTVAFLQSLHESKADNYSVNDECDKLINSLRQSKEYTFVNCWHASEHESVGMWKTYLQYPYDGVALKSTVGKLKKAINYDPRISIGYVKYIDYHVEQPNKLHPCWYKQIPYQYENEIRAVIQIPSLMAGRGFLVKCNMGDLIDRIVFSPFSSNYFKNSIAALLEKYNMGTMIQPSELEKQLF